MSVARQRFYGSALFIALLVFVAAPVAIAQAISVGSGGAIGPGSGGGGGGLPSSGGDLTGDLVMTNDTGSTTGYAVQFHDASNTVRGNVQWNDSSDRLQINTSAAHDIVMNTDGQISIEASADFTLKANGASNNTWFYDSSSSQGDLVHTVGGDVIAHTITLSSGHTADALVVEQNDGTDVYNVDPDGQTTIGGAGTDGNLVINPISQGVLLQTEASNDSIYLRAGASNGAIALQDSSANTVFEAASSYVAHNVDVNITASASSDRTGATAFSGRFITVSTVGTAGDSVKPSFGCSAGRTFTLKNKTATSLDLFPFNASETIDGGAGGAAVAVAGGAVVTVVCEDGTNYETF